MADRTLKTVLNEDTMENASLSGIISVAGITIPGSFTNLTDINQYPSVDETKVGFISITENINLDDISNAVNLNTNKVGITTAQSDAIIANTSKIGVTTELKNLVEDTTPQLGGDLDTHTHNIIMGDTELSRAILKDYGYKVHDIGSIASGTNTFDYTNGSIQTWTATGDHTLATSNWPPTGNLGEMLLIGTNLGAVTITLPPWIWTLKDGTTTTNFTIFLAQNGTRLTFQETGIDKILLISRDAGVTIFASLLSI